MCCSRILVEKKKTRCITFWRGAFCRFCLHFRCLLQTVPQALRLRLFASHLITLIFEHTISFTQFRHFARHKQLINQLWMRMTPMTLALPILPAQTGVSNVLNRNEADLALKTRAQVSLCLFHAPRLLLSTRLIAKCRLGMPSLAKSRVIWRAASSLV